MKRLLRLLALLSLAVILRAQDLAPSVVSDSLFSIVITQGTYPMATSGSVARMINADGSYVDLIASPEVGTTTGTYVYTKTGAASARVVFTSSSLPTNTAFLTFTSTKTGTYTLSVGAFSNMQSGTFALVETTPPLVNISTRVTLATGQHTNAGFVIHGSVARTVLIRAVGPRLKDFGVPVTVLDPKLDLYSGTTKLLSNDNWETGSAPAATVASEAARVGAFALKAGSKDAALITTLAPGNYTVEGLATTTDDAGDILVEVYLLQ